MLFPFDRELCLETGSCVMHEGCSGIVKGLGRSLGIGRSRRVCVCAHTHTHTYMGPSPHSHLCKHTHGDISADRHVCTLHIHIHVDTQAHTSQSHSHVSTCPDHRDTGTHVLTSAYMQTLVVKQKDTRAPRQADSCVGTHVHIHTHIIYCSVHRASSHILTHLLTLVNTYTGSQRAPSVLMTVLYLPFTINKYMGVTSQEDCVCQ